MNFFGACDGERQNQTPRTGDMTVHEETRRRIRVAVAAWAYEVHNDPIMSDAEFDELARQIDLDQSTARGDLDEWFANHFHPDTGIWVHDHPEKDGLERVYQMLRRSKVDPFVVWLLAA